MVNEAVSRSFTNVLEDDNIVNQALHAASPDGPKGQLLSRNGLRIFNVDLFADPHQFIRVREVFDEVELHRKKVAGIGDFGPAYDTNGISASHGISMAKSLGLHDFAEREGFPLREDVITSDWTASWGITGAPYTVINRIMNDQHVEEILDLYKSDGQYFSTLGRSVIHGKEPELLHSQTLTVYCGEFSKDKREAYEQLLRLGLKRIAGGADIIQLIVMGILIPPYIPGIGYALPIESRIFEPIELKNAKQYVNGEKKMPLRFKKSYDYLKLDIDMDGHFSQDEQDMARMSLALMGFKQNGVKFS